MSHRSNRTSDPGPWDADLPVQPPYPIDFHVAMGCGIFRTFLPMEGVDASGRTLREGRSVHLKPEPGDYRVCPYPGVRNGHEKAMNCGALIHLARRLDCVHEYMSSLSSTLFDNNGPEAHDSVGPIWHVLKVAYSAYKAPLLWLICAWAGKPMAPPSEVAAAAKATEGIYELALQFLDADTSGSGPKA